MKKNFNGYVNQEQMSENNKALVSKLNTDIINLMQQYDSYIKRYIHDEIIKNIKNINQDKTNDII